MPSTRRSVLAACTAGVGTLAGCLSTETPTADGSWSRRAFDNAHTGYATTAGPTTDLHTAWRRELSHHSAVTSPVVDDGTLYYARGSNLKLEDADSVWIDAFDAVTGDSLWTTEIVGPDPSTGSCSSRDFCNSDSLVVDGDRLFHQTWTGLTMLTTDGERRWTFDNRHQWAAAVAAPVVTDELVVAGTYHTQGKGVHGIDPATGDERWRATFPEVDGTLWQLAGTDGVVYVPLLGDGLVALDLTTGTERWRWDGPIYGTPTVVDDLLLVPLRHGDEQHSLVALDRRDRSVRWQVPIGSRSPSAGLSVSHGRVYHLAAHGIEARDLETGERIWRFGGERYDQDEPVRGVPQFLPWITPAVSGDAVYVSGSIRRDRWSGYLFVVDAATGEELGRVELGHNEFASAATPAVTSDLVFLVYNYDTLSAFGECSFEVAGRCLRG